MNSLAIWLAERVFYLVPVWISLSLHEWAHARMAYALGDDTAERLGRMTINPLEHIHPVGTFLLPLAGIPFGWAVPVPVSPSRFRGTVSQQVGMMWVAAAGPLSNLVLALFTLLAYRQANGHAPGAILDLLAFTFRTNLALALFNLLPLPPLDGSRIVDAFIPYNKRALWQTYGPVLGVVLVVAFLLFAGSWIGQMTEAILDSGS